MSFSAYCGSLWLAALRVTVSMAEELDMFETAEDYREILSHAREAFIKKLWNGEYFNFDERSRSKCTIMADQLCGYWFLQSISPDLANDVRIFASARVLLVRTRNWFGLMCNEFSDAFVPFSRFFPFVNCVAGVFFVNQKDI